MKAQVTISGQIGGNFKLKSKIACNGNYTSIENGMFNSFYINFDTVGEAKKALRKAWKQIKSEDDSLTNFDGMNKDYSVLNYDASKAVLNIITTWKI
jgi:hypothetical protein